MRMEAQGWEHKEECGDGSVGMECCDVIMGMGSWGQECGNESIWTGK